MENPWENYHTLCLANFLLRIPLSLFWPPALPIKPLERNLHYKKTAYFGIKMVLG